MDSCQGDILSGKEHVRLVLERVGHRDHLSAPMVREVSDRRGNARRRILQISQVLPSRAALLLL